MNEMIERVAKALLARREESLSFSLGTTIQTWNEVPQWHADLLADARAAIAAMREPTEAMSDAPASILCKIADAAAFDKAYLADFDCCEDAADTIWQAMIDAALKDEPGS
jgi:hypothetical protein